MAEANIGILSITGIERAGIIANINLLTDMHDV
jgi:hypothetical protein